LSVIFIPSFLSIVIGIIFVTSINPVTSLLVKKYETIKAEFESEQNYLAAVTVNGIWIKEKSINKNYIIRSTSLEGQNLMDVTIYEFDKDNNFNRRIEAESADISNLKWELKNIKILNSEGVILSQNIKKINHISMYDIHKIRSLYSNLDTVSFWNLVDEIKILKERGYSTKEMQVKLHKALAFPLFLLSMLLLSSVFTLGNKYNDNNYSYAFLTIISSILIFFFNDFSAALGRTDKLPIELSVWIPIAIIFIFSSIGIIHANRN